MEILILLLVVAFIVGLVFRKKGDGFLDTLSSGCTSIILILFILGLIIYFWKK